MRQVQSQSQPMLVGATRHRKRTAQIEPYVFLVPALVLYAVFFVGPVVYSWFLSVVQWDLISDDIQFVAAAHYVRALTDPGWWQSLGTTVLYVLGTVPLSVGLGLGTAVLVEAHARSSRLWRVIFFVPIVTTVAAAGLIWSYMFNPQVGIINQALAAVGIRGPNWFFEPTWALVAVCLVGIWQSFGYNMVLFIGGLKQIDCQLYEAADIDGASRWRQFRHITLPLLSPITFFVTVISVIGSFQVFATVQIMTRGGPNNATNVAVYRIWEYAFQFYDIGYASASATLLFLLIACLTLVQFRYGEERVHYQ